MQPNPADALRSPDAKQCVCCITDCTMNVGAGAARVGSPSQPACGVLDVIQSQLCAVRAPLRSKHRKHRRKQFNNYQVGSQIAQGTCGPVYLCLNADT